MALHCCVGFCSYYRIWLGHKYTYVPSLENLPPTPPSLEVITEQQAELPLPHGSFPLATYFTHGSEYMSIPISQLNPLSSSPTQVHMAVLYICVCIPALQKGPLVPFF